MPVVSIIIPVYNTSQYLSACIESVLNQSYSDFEMILVDDGSTDGSGRICDGFAEKDRRVVVLHQKNEGVSSARNRGIDNARGEFIVFVDADDLVTDVYLEHLMESDADMVVAGIRKFGANNDTSIPARRDDFGIEGLATHWNTPPEMNYLYCYPVPKRFRSRILREHGIRFDESLFFSEDMCFNMDYFCHAESFTELPYADYRYRILDITRDEKYRMSAEELVTHHERLEDCFHRLYERIGADTLAFVRDNTNLRLMRKFYTFLMQERGTPACFNRNIRLFREKKWAESMLRLLKGRKEIRVMKEAVHFPLLTYWIEVRLSSLVHRLNPRRMQSMLILVLSLCSFSAYSCTREEMFFPIPEPEYLDTLTIEEVIVYPHLDSSSLNSIEVNHFAPLGFSHQSAAAYGDYAFFVSNGRSEICLYSLKKKEKLFTLALKGNNGAIYHCNQSTFGVDKYESSDYFPLLYISQRANSEGRCFIEAFRIIPQYNEDMSEIDSFHVELVQTIYLPKMTRDNSLGNANCVIDARERVLYVYSRNNNSEDDNYQQCKISRFEIPEIRTGPIMLEDDSIVSSFMIEASAVNMQGGCIHDGLLFIGQGYDSAGYILLNVVDLKMKQLIMRIDLQEFRVGWEPEGCFFYDGSVMLTHYDAISRIDQK